jgi:ubiquinol-cytochrome c reductase iron-sulfur subunit
MNIESKEDNEPQDKGRRRFLTLLTSAIGSIGAVFAAIPFISAWTPSVRARALGAPVSIDISKIEPGQKITVPWRGKPIFVLRRTPEELKSLSEDESRLRDPFSQESAQPAYAKNQYRSIKEPILVVEGICTHLGCVPIFKPEGFFCPCHGSTYDMAGRVYKGVPAPLNLPVPPYQYLSENMILIGEDQASEGKG